MLVFFSSYKVMEDVHNSWKSNGITSLIRQHKTICIEAKRQNQNLLVIEQFKEHFKTGAVLLAVMGGKLSEGFDFIDEMARAIFVVGIPFPYLKDPKIVAKKQFVDRNLGGWSLIGDISGDKWYFEKGIRTLNQSVGRIIRHSRDFGMIFFMDNRIMWRRIHAKLSSWIKKWKIREYSYEKSLKLQEVFFSGEVSIMRKKRLLAESDSSGRAGDKTKKKQIASVHKKEQKKNDQNNVNCAKKKIEKGFLGKKKQTNTEFPVSHDERIEIMNQLQKKGEKRISGLDGYFKNVRK